MAWLVQFLLDRKMGFRVVLRSNIHFRLLGPLTWRWVSLMHMTMAQTNQRVQIAETDYGGRMLTLYKPRSDENMSIALDKLPTATQQDLDSYLATGRQRESKSTEWRVWLPF